MAHKQVLFRSDAREKILRGVTALADAVRVTLGPHACAAKAPGFGDRRKAMLEDVAILTGGKALTEDLGIALEHIKLEDLGRAKKVIVDKGGGDPRRGALRVEMKSRREALEDAIASTKAAVAEGIVPGGGLALLRAIPAVEKEEIGAEGEERTGLQILRRALEIPARQIAENSGVDGGVVVERMRNGSGAFGFDAARREYVDGGHPDRSAGGQGRQGAGARRLRT
jgi:chaperonin GroEL